MFLRPPAIVDGVQDRALINGGLHVCPLLGHPGLCDEHADPGAKFKSTGTMASTI